MHTFATQDGRDRMLGALATVAVVLALTLNRIAEEMTFNASWIVSAPTVAASFLGLYRLVDRRAWRWPWLRALGLIDTPDLQGTYDGKLTSAYDGVERDVVLMIDQTWTKLLVRMALPSEDTSKSRSISALLDREGIADARLIYTYKSSVNRGIAEAGLHDHDGTADLSFDAEAGSLHGPYFNARCRTGTLDLVRRAF